MVIILAYNYLKLCIKYHVNLLEYHLVNLIHAQVLAMHDHVFFNYLFYLLVIVLNLSIILFKQVPMTLDISELPLIIVLTNQVLICEIELSQAQCIQILCGKLLTLINILILQYHLCDVGRLVLRDVNTCHFYFDLDLGLMEVAFQIYEEKGVTDEDLVGNKLGSTNFPFIIVF